jgi:hypothetical protein
MQSINRVFVIPQNSSDSLSCPSRSSQLHALCQRKLMSFFLEGFPSLCKNHFEALSTFDSVLFKAIERKHLDLVFYPVPTTTYCCDFGALNHVGFRGRRCQRRAVDDSFANREDVSPCEVHAAHGDLFRSRIDVGGFVYDRCVGASHDGLQPFRC